MRAVRRLTASGPLSAVDTIYLATDSWQVVREAKSNYPQYTWLHFGEALDYSTHLNPGNKKWDNVLRGNKERSGGGGSSGVEPKANPNMRLAALATMDAIMLSHCDLFVGKFSSNFFRIAYELHAARCDCAAPFESLDHAWCFDWGVEAGGSGNATHEC